MTAPLVTPLPHEEPVVDVESVRGKDRDSPVEHCPHLVNRPLNRSRRGDILDPGPGTLGAQAIDRRLVHPREASEGTLDEVEFVLDNQGWRG